MRFLNKLLATKTAYWLERVLAIGLIAGFGSMAGAGALATYAGKADGPRKDCPCVNNGGECKCTDCQSGGCAASKAK